MFDGIAESLEMVREEYSKTFVPYEKQLPLVAFTSADSMTYYIYNGSSPFFSCPESEVIWLDFLEPIEVSPKLVRLSNE